MKTKIILVTNRSIAALVVKKSHAAVSNEQRANFRRLQFGILKEPNDWISKSV